MQDDHEEYSATNNNDLGVIDSLHKGIALTLAATIAISIAYNFSFFSTLGTNYFGIMSTQDYISSALAWFPAAIISHGWGYFVTNAMAQRIYGTTENIYKKSVHLGNTLFALTMIFVMLVLIFMIMTLPMDALASILLIISIYISVRLSRKKNLRQFSTWYMRHLALSPALFGVALGVGNLEANLKLHERHGDTDIELTDGRTYKDSILIRQFSNGVLFRSTDEFDMKFVRWDLVAIFTINLPKSDHRTIACRKFNAWCN